MSKVVFKQDLQHQTSLFPFNFESLISREDPVRVVSEVVEQLNIDEILKTYKGGGTSSYHPRQMLKIIIYSYLNNIYSSRKIEIALHDSVKFLWLSGQSFPDHNTINNFRGKRLKSHIDEIFKQVVKLLSEMGIISLEETFTDGTKIESAANRYTFVWRGSTEKYKVKLEERICSVLKDISTAIDEDNSFATKETETKSAISSAELKAKIQELNEQLSKQKVSKQVQKKVNILSKESLPKLEKYERDLSAMGDRNSYSKTDTDATFMRMKDDHMKNGQLKPAYNVQLSTENNIITNYSIHQRPGDTATFKEHLESYYKKYGHYPKRAITDAGYGSLENYTFLEENQIESYVKYNYFHKEQSKSFKQDISKVENLYYNEDGDYFICPMGQKMCYVEASKKKSELGFEYEVRHYSAKNCKQCPLRGACHKSKYNRTIEVNHKLRHYKQQAKNNLNSDLGKELRGRRCTEVEQTFGQIKWNKKFNRFLLRGKELVNVEIGLVSIAHNLLKLAKKGKNKLKNSFFKSYYNLLYCLMKFLEILQVHFSKKIEFAL